MTEQNREFAAAKRRKNAAHGAKPWVKLRVRQAPKVNERYRDLSPAQALGPNQTDRRQPGLPLPTGRKLEYFKPAKMDQEVRQLKHVLLI
jgi:hypothetical protein